MNLPERIKTLGVAIGHWISSKELLVYLVFVLLAGTLWYGHAMTSVRNARITVHISYTGIPDRIAFQTPLPETITIEIRDAGRRLIGYRRDNMQVTLDLSNLLTFKQGELRITEDVLRHSLSGLLQGTSKLQQLMPEQIQTYYYTQQEKVVPIKICSTFTADNEYVFLNQPKLSSNQIHIYGSSEALSTVDTICTEALNIEHLRDSICIGLKLETPQDIRLSTDSVHVQAIAERFTEKIVTVPVYVSGTPEDKVLRTFPREVTVTLRVSMAHFAEITASNVHAICHFPFNNERELPVKITYKNPYIYGARVNPSTLEFIIENNENK